jgi:hypothetical protein
MGGAGEHRVDAAGRGNVVAGSKVLRHTVAVNAELIKELLALARRNESTAHVLDPGT